MADPTFIQGGIIPRQVGGQDSIRLITERRPKRRATAPSAPSIPSRYETKLYTQPQERDAFSSRTARFAPTTITRPGPGAYELSQSELGRVGLLKTSQSISKKGYGAGFVSNESRFKHSFLERAENALYTPGPGYYSQIDGFTRNLQAIAARPEVVPFNSSTPGVSQTNPSAYSAAVQGTSASGLVPAIASGYTSSDATDVPGPGAYKLPSAMFMGSGSCVGAPRLRVVRQATSTGAPADAFLSSVPRFGTNGTSTAAETSASTSARADNTPAPGQYEVQAAFAATQTRTNKAAGAASVFKSRSSRIGADTLSAALLRGTPGPGAYDVAHAVGAASHGPAPISILAEKSASGNALPPSSSFAPRADDRFGRPLQPRVARDKDVVPGPGAYEVSSTQSARPGRHEEHKNRHAFGTTAAAAATTTSATRTTTAGTEAQPPGPGAYAVGTAKDTTTTKRSFHLNTQFPAVWVT